MAAADPGARTTDPSLQDAVLQASAALGRPLFVLFNHPAARVADGTAVIMRAIAERGAAAAAPMRDAALREGAILHHLQLALFASGGHVSCFCFLDAAEQRSFKSLLHVLGQALGPITVLEQLSSQQIHKHYALVACCAWSKFEVKSSIYLNRQHLTTAFVCCLHR